MSFTLTKMKLGFNQKVEIATNNNAQPKGDGVHFDRFAELPCSKLKRNKENSNKLILTNKVRSGLDMTYVTKFVEIIQRDRYKYHYEPPTVIDNGDGTYELVTGEHRLEAHLCAEEETIFVAICKFDSLEDRRVFQCNENSEDDEYIKNVRTESDVVLTVCSIINENNLDINDVSVLNRLLHRLNQKSGDFPQLREQILANFGIITAVRNYNPISRDKWISENLPEITVSTRSKIVPVDNTIFTTRTFKGGSGQKGLRDLDYDGRCFFEVAEFQMKNPDCEVQVIGQINGATSTKLTELREFKERKMWSEWERKVLKVADGIRENIVHNPEWSWLPQLSGVDIDGGLVK
jgi:hypothetical protein